MFREVKNNSKAMNRRAGQAVNLSSATQSFTHPGHRGGHGHPRSLASRKMAGVATESSPQA